jgi:hypothetical protein
MTHRNHFTAEETRKAVNHQPAGLASAIFLIFALAADSSAEISESKRMLIQELLEISGGASMPEQMAEQQTYVELMRIRPSYEPMMEFAVSEQRDLSDQEQQALLEKLGDFEAFATMFRARFMGRLNFSKIVAEVYYPLYGEAFSEDDLAKMLEFYRTRVGRKAIELMPGIMQRASQGIDRIVRPAAIEVIQGIVADERAKLGSGP